MSQNILDNFSFQDDRPGIASVKKSDKSNVFAVGLKKNQMMKKHRTPLETTLVVLKGSIVFSIQGDNLSMHTGTVYAIPPTIEHEVMGVDEENIFLLIQEK